MKVHGLIISYAILVLVLVGCSDSDSNKSTSANTIQDAYYKNVVPESAANLVCTSKVAQGREFVLCVYGEGRWPHKDLWMVDHGHYYALNGKALSLLDKLKNNSIFALLPSRIKVNVAGVMSIFENGEPADNLVEEVLERTVSQDEINAYCSYMKEKDRLTIEANSRFGDKNLFSEERAAWIEPKIVELRKRYFEAQGMQYFEVSGKVVGAGVRCPR